MLDHLKDCQLVMVLLSAKFFFFFPPSNDMIDFHVSLCPPSIFLEPVFPALLPLSNQRIAVHSAKSILAIL
jgi:hypothetical protein